MNLLQKICRALSGASTPSARDAALVDPAIATKSLSRSEAIRALVLDRLYPEFSGCPNGSYPGSAADVAHYRKRIEEIRLWAGTLGDTETRLAYLGWMSYYSNQVEAAVEELRTGRRRAQHEAYCAASDEKDRRVREFAAANPPVPAPPRGDGGR